MTVLKLCILIGVHLVAFTLPGAVAVGLWQTAPDRFRRRVSRSIHRDLLNTLVCSGLLAYGSFFTYVLSPLAGRAYSLSTFLSCLAVLIVRPALRTHLRAQFAHRDVLAPLLLALCIGVLYTGSTLLYGGEVHVSLVANSRYRDPLPPDNILPRLVAERVVDGLRGEPFLGDWLSSDRPPLQSAVETFVSPFIPKGSRELNYQALATMLQLLIIPAGWILLRRLGLDFEVTFGVITATALSGTVALHSTYVWPKLLCAAYSLLCIAGLLDDDLRGTEPGSKTASKTGSKTSAEPGKKSDRVLLRGLLSGAALGLSFAAHGGALFVALPMICVLIVLVSRSFWQARVLRDDQNGKPPTDTKTALTQPGAIVLAIGGGVMVCALLFMPWLAYQRMIAPPGNRLLKWHLAGVVDIDQRSFGEALVDGYTKPSWRELVANKTSNVRELVNPERFLADVVPVLGSDDSIDRVRQREFGSLGNATSIAMAGLGLGLVGLVVKRRRSLELIVGLLGLAATALATALWCAALYGPKATLPHQGSLALPLIIVASSALLAASAHRWALRAFVVLSAYKVTRVWILAGPLSPERQRSTAALSALFLGGLALVGLLLVTVKRPNGLTHLPTPTDVLTAEIDLMLA